jgi:4a-hydroxytetrahydrobiopterin dehydratase
MNNLHELKCVPCRGGEPPLSEAEIVALQPQVPDWNIIEVNGEKRLSKVFKFKNFAQALAFTNQVGALAEAEDHHPALLTEWGKVTVSWWTHIIRGLHQNDFIMASKTDRLYSG